MIFDEPTLGLDIMLPARSSASSRMRQRGKTVIFLDPRCMSEVEKLVRHHRHYPVRELLAEGSLAALRSRYSENDLEEKSS